MSEEKKTKGFNEAVIEAARGRRGQQISKAMIDTQQKSRSRRHD